MTVDIHRHVVVPELTGPSAPEGWRVRIVRDHDRWAVTFRGATVTTVVQEFVAVDAIVHEAASEGIDSVVLSPWVSLVPTAAERRTAVSVCRLQNGSLASMVGSHANVEAFGVVPVQFPEVAAAELTEVIDMGLVGVHVPAAVNGRSLGDDGFAPFWEAAEALGAVVLVHPSRLTLGLSGLEDYYLSNALGHLMETAVTGAQMVMGGVMERHPALRVILSHGGGCLLAARGRLRHAYACRVEARSRLREGPDVSLRRFYHDTITHDADILRELIGYAGPDRVLLGTDRPFDMGQDRPVEMVRSLALPPRDEALILEGNALRMIASQERLRMGA
jgi:aminocarboxymuconate-semialdehyde decarboxylase